MAFEELGCRDLSRRCLYHRIEREADRGIVASRFIGGNGASQRAAVTHSRISDMTGESCQDWQMVAQYSRAADLSMCCSRANGNCAITELDLLGYYAHDVDQTGRRVKAELHVPQESLTAGKQHRSICGSEK